MLSIGLKRSAPADGRNPHKWQKTQSEIAQPSAATDGGGQRGRGGSCAAAKHMTQGVRARLSASMHSLPACDSSAAILAAGLAQTNKKCF
jgi:hypothetical protein